MHGICREEKFQRGKKKKKLKSSEKCCIIVIGTVLSDNLQLFLDYIFQLFVSIHDSKI